jgi:hypothetical protein
MLEFDAVGFPRNTSARQMPRKALEALTADNRFAGGRGMPCRPGEFRNDILG